MALVKCPECGNTVSGSASAYPSCGYDVAAYFRQIEDRQKAIEDRQKAKAEEIATARERMAFRFAVRVTTKSQYKDTQPTFSTQFDTFDSREAAETKMTEAKNNRVTYNRTGTLCNENEIVELMEAPEGKYYAYAPKFASPGIYSDHVWIKDDGLRDIPPEVIDEYNEAKRHWKEEEAAIAERHRQEAERQRKAEEAAAEKRRQEAAEKERAAKYGVTVEELRRLDATFGIKNDVATKYNGPGGDVTIPPGVTSIGTGAFTDCKGLTSITIPEGVGIEKDAFPFEASAGTWTYKDGRGWKKKGCFITTAVCGSFGKADDCRELMAFRAFRDGWLAQQPDGHALIDEYYRTAPGIVAAIDRSADRGVVYSGIWDTYMAECLRLIDAGDFASCKRLYMAMVEGLKKEWL
jgi:hypothetical protein